MNKALQEYYNGLVFKDKAGTKYFFDIDWVSDEGISTPIISIKQNRRNATGAEVFKQAIEHIEKNDLAVSVNVREYNSCSDDATPIVDENIPLRSDKKKKKKSKQQRMPQQQQQPTDLFGLGNPDQTQSYMSIIDRQMGLFGIEGGLRGLITNTAQQITIQDKLTDAQQQCQELKLENKQLQAQIANLKDQLESQKDEHKRLEYKLMDAERDYKHMDENYKQKLSLGSVAANAFMGFCVQKFHLDEKLGGLLGGDEEQTATSTGSQQVSDDNIKLTQVNTETASYVSDINQYLNTLDKSRIELVYAICQYLSTGDEQLKDVARYVQSKSKK